MPGMPIDPSARMMTSWVGGCTWAGSSARVVIVLPCGRPASANAANSATAASAHPHHGANAVTSAAAMATAAASPQQDPGRGYGATPSPSLVEPDPVVRLAVDQNGLRAEILLLQHPPPVHLAAADAGGADDGPDQHGEQVQRRKADAVGELGASSRPGQTPAWPGCWPGPAGTAG